MNYAMSLSVASETALNEGIEHFHGGYLSDCNPYAGHPVLEVCWLDGWRVAAQDAERLTGLLTRLQPAESGHFAPAAELKPLLHTWSLAVEEQFYVLFPLFLLMFHKFGRQLLLLLFVVLAALSLGLTEWASRTDPSANFYLLPTRAWELGVGAILAISANNWMRMRFASGPPSWKPGLTWRKPWRWSAGYTVRPLRRI